LDEPEEYIDFMAKYRDWIAMKRFGIRPSTRPEEIVHHLASIRTTIDSKSYPFLGINTSLLDEHAKRVSAGMKRNYDSLSVAFKSMSYQETRRILEQSCAKNLVPIAETYLIGKVVTNVGFDTSINQTQMSKAFPDLKAPRGLGRKSKKG
jgi:hypothetical protein